jgi:hypothetical protein
VRLVNVWLLVINMIPCRISWNGSRLDTDGKQLLALLDPRQAQRSSLHMWLLERLRELQAFADQAQWPEVQRVGREYLRTQEAKHPQAWSSIAAWVAVADVWMDQEGDLQEADALSRRCREIAPPEPAIMIVRACVLMAQAREADAEILLRDGWNAPLQGAAKAAAAHLWAELYRRRGDAACESEWARIAVELDPRMAYQMPWKRIGIVPLLIPAAK